MKFTIRRNNMNMATSAVHALEGRPTVRDDVNISFGRSDTLTVSSVDYATFKVENNTANKGVRLGDYIEILASYNTGVVNSKVNMNFALIGEDLALAPFQTLPTVDNFNEYLTLSDNDTFTYSLNYSGYEKLHLYAQVVLVHFTGKKRYLNLERVFNNTPIKVDFGTLADGEYTFYIRLVVDYEYLKVKHLANMRLKDFGTLKIKDLQELNINLESSTFRLTSKSGFETVKIFDGYADIITTRKEGNTDLSTINCVSLFAHLQARMIGDKPFPTQTVQERLDTINGLCDSEYTFIVPTHLQDMLLIRKDVDNTSVGTLLEDIAKSTDTIIRIIDKTTIYFESLDTRAVNKIIYRPAPNLPFRVKTSDVNAIRLSASSINKNIEATYSNTNNATIIKTSWQEETLNEQGEREINEHYYTLKNESLLPIVGYKTLTCTTDLVYKDLAVRLANKIMARQTSEPTYTNVDIDVERVDNLHEFFTLINTITRNGKYVIVNNAPRILTSSGLISGYIEGANLRLKNKKISMQAHISPIPYGASTIRVKDMANVKLKDFGTLRVKDLYNAQLEQS